MPSQQNIVPRSGFVPTDRPEGSSWAKRAGALLFCAAIASSPLLVVHFSPGHDGGLFVAGYLFAVLTAPFVVVGLIGAANTLFRGNWLDSLVGATLYAVLVTLISIAAIVWAFF